MSNKKGSDSTIHKSINQRASKAQMYAITQRTVELLRQNKTYTEVKDVLRGELNKSDAQLERYITRAFDFIREEFEGDAARTRTEFVQGLIGDYNEAIKNYNAIPDPESKMKATWFKLAMDVKDRIERFIPHAQIENSEDVVNVEYKILPFKVENEE